jgi:hypothetical protein
MKRILQALRERFATFEADTEEEVTRAKQEHHERLLRSPISFRSWDDFVAYRRKHGLRTRPDHPRRPES